MPSSQNVTLNYLHIE